MIDKQTIINNLKDLLSDYSQRNVMEHLQDIEDAVELLEAAETADTDTDQHFTCNGDWCELE